jgi:hypothetical protein
VPHSCSSSVMSNVNALYHKADMPFWMSLLFLNHVIGLLLDDHRYLSCNSQECMSSFYCYLFCNIIRQCSYERFAQVTAFIHIMVLCLINKCLCLHNLHNSCTVNM